MPAHPTTEADWSVHLLQLAARGELGRATPKLLLDLPALSQPWTCATGVCTPGRRAPDARSCCADLEVEPSPAERAAIEAVLPEVAAFLAPRDARWAAGTPEVFDGDALRRPGRRCIFGVIGAIDGTDGLSCGLHALEDATGRTRGALKPLPCRLFPLVIVDIEDGRTLLTAISRRTWRHAGSRPARAFKCLGLDGAPTIAEACADTVTSLFGAKAARRAVEAAREWVGSGE